MEGVADMNKIIDTSNLKRVLTKIDDIKSDKGHSHAPYVPHGQVIGVNGTLESRSLPLNTWTKVKFVPNDGVIGSIDSGGNWICSQSGIYGFTAGIGGTHSGLGNRAVGFQINSPDTYNVNNLRGYLIAAGDIIFPTTSITVKLNKDDNVTFWAISGVVATTINGSVSPFSITLNSSIDITVWDAYETWKSLNPATNTASFDDWIDAKLKQSTRRVQANVNNTNLVANVYKKMTCTYVNGESGLFNPITQRFVAPVAGLYIIGVTAARAGATGAQQIWIQKNSDTADLTLNTIGSIILSSTTILPPITLPIWLNQGDYLTLHYVSSVAQSTIASGGMNSTVEFALLYSGNLTANDLFIGAVDNGFVGDYEDWSKSVITSGGMLVNIEYASNDDTIYTGTATANTDNSAVNRENGSLGLRLSTVIPGTRTTRRLNWETPYNPSTDILEVQISTDRVTWAHLQGPCWSVGNSFVCPRTLTTDDNERGIGVYFSNIFAFGKYPYGISNWSIFTQDWYWRVVKKTFAKITMTEWEKLQLLIANADTILGNLK